MYLLRAPHYFDPMVPGSLTFNFFLFSLSPYASQGVIRTGDDTHHIGRRNTPAHVDLSNKCEFCDIKELV